MTLQKAKQKQKQNPQKHTNKPMFRETIIVLSDLLA
jgi:hypothetical protein